MRQLRDQQRAARLLAECESLLEAGPEVLRIVCETFGWDFGTIWLVDGRRTRIQPVAVWGSSSFADAGLERATLGCSLAPGSGLPGRVWASGRPEWGEALRDPDGSPRLRCEAAGAVRAALAVPFVAGAGVAGVLELLARSERPRGDEVLEGIGAYAVQVGLHCARQVAVRRERLLLDAMAALDSSLDPEVATHRLAEALVPELGELAVVDLVRPGGRIQAVSVAAVDPSAATLVRHLRERFPLDTSSRNPVAEVVRTGRPWAIDEVDDELLAGFAGSEEELELFRSFECRAAVVAPVRARGRTLGTLSVAHLGGGSRHYGEDERRLLDELGRRAGIVIENAHLHALAVESERTQRFLAEASRVLASSLDWRETLEQVARLAVPAVADWCLVDVVDDHGELQRVAVASSDPGTAELAARLQQRPNRSRGRYGVRPVFESGVAQLVTDITGGMLAGVAEDAEHLEDLRAMRPRSHVIAPLKARGRTLGTITLISTRPGRRYDERDLALVEEIASRSALAIDNSRLYEGARATERRLQAQIETAPDGVLLVSHDGRIVSFNHRFAEMWHIPEDVIASGSDQAALDFVMDEVADPDGFRARVAELYSRPDEEALDEIVLNDGRVFERHSAPVRERDGRHHGRMWFFRDVTARRRDEQGVRLLADASAAFSASLDPGDVVGAIPRVALPDLADVALVLVPSPDGEIRDWAAAPADGAFEAVLGEPDEQDQPRCAALLELVPADGASVLPEVPRALLDAAAARGVGAGLRSAIAVALRARHGIVGGMLLARSAPGYDTTDLAVARELGTRAALALENARLYVQQREIARTLQESLLPASLPAPPGIDLAARYLAGGEGTIVGGDFYDVFESPPSWLLVMGDVCGKGAQAAALTGLARHTLRAAARADCDPRAALAAVNEVVRREARDARFLTAAVVALDPRPDGVGIRACCAGHPPPFVVRAGGEVEILDGAHGCLLGIFESPELDEVEGILGPGDALVLYTDGVSDARSDDGLLGFEGIEAALRGAAGRGLDDLVEALEAAAVRLGAPADDIAILACRVSPGTAAAGNGAVAASTPLVAG